MARALHIGGIGAIIEIHVGAGQAIAIAELAGRGIVAGRIGHRIDRELHQQRHRGRAIGQGIGRNAGQRAARAVAADRDPDSDGGTPGDPAVSGWQRTDAPTWGAVPPSGSQAGPAPGAGSAGIVFGAILIVIGAWFLVRQYVQIDWDVVWPVIVIGLGALLIAGAMRRR